MERVVINHRNICDYIRAHPELLFKQLFVSKQCFQQLTSTGANVSHPCVNVYRYEWRTFPSKNAKEWIVLTSVNQQIYRVSGMKLENQNLYLPPPKGDEIFLDF